VGIPEETCKDIGRWSKLKVIALNYINTFIAKKYLINSSESTYWNLNCSDDDV
jgi:hypothetical protein